MLLKMSLSGGGLIIFIIILRHILNNKIPKRVFVLLWDIVILRLVIPFDLPFKYGILQPLLQSTSKARPVNPAPAVIPGTLKKPSIQAKIQDIPGAAANTFNINLPVLIWITVTVTLVIIFALLYLKEYQIIREAIPVTKEQEINLRQMSGIPEGISLLTSDRISTPLASGIIHPGIIFPKLFKPDNMLSLKYIATHELIHIKRADNLWKVIILAALCIHWFNPLVWLMYILFNRDLEMSCDEKVLYIFGENAKKDYAMALVDFAENQYSWQFFSNGFGKKPVKERIEAIMNYKKITVPGTICAAVLLGTAVTVFAKGTVPEDNNQKVINTQNNIGKMENLVNENASGATPSAIYNCYEGKNNDFSYFANTEEFKEYEKYGLSYNEKTGHLMYNGKIVGYFHDETSKNVFTHLTDEAGEVGIKVKRNSDNEITGFEEVGIPYVMEPFKEEENPDVKIVTYALDDFYAVSEDDGEDNVETIVSETTVARSSCGEDDGGDNSTLLEDYKKHGITYNKSADMWQYKGKNIAGFWDKSKMLYTSGATRKNSVYLIIDNGNVKEVTKKEFKKVFED